MKHIIQYDNRYHHHHHCPCRTALSSWFSSPCWQCPPPLNRKCHDRQFFGQSVGSRHLFLWIFMSLIWRKYGICFGQHPWDFLSISRGEMGSASLPALTQAIFKAAKGPKPRCVAFLWCWVNMKNSHHRLQNGHRCRGWSTLGDARKETLRCEPCGRGHQFFEVRQYRGACGHRPIKKRGSIHRNDSPCSLSIYLRKMTWRHQKWKESIAMFDFQVFFQLFLHMRWGTWLKFPKFINQHFLLPLVSNHPKGCSPWACRCWGYPILLTQWCCLIF